MVVESRKKVEEQRDIR